MAVRYSSYALPLVALTCFFAPSSGCSNDDPEGAAIDAQAEYLQHELDALVTAVTAIKTAAPAPDSDGWNATTDAAAVATMRTQWAQARIAYEHVESSVATFFADLDTKVDQRYDAFLGEINSDPNLFDGVGVTGMHAVERILWANQIPAHVVAFESKLTGYTLAEFPDNLQKSTDFRDLLLTQLIADSTQLRDDYAKLALRLNSGEMYRGVFDSMNEQIEKTDKAATGEAESRYADTTLSDMKANLAGGKTLYQAFSPWIRSKTNGKALDQAVLTAFARLEAVYAAYPGDVLPEVPADWNSVTPVPEHLQTRFGQLWLAVHNETDLSNPISLVSSVVAAGRAIGAPFSDLVK